MRDPQCGGCPPCCSQCVFSPEGEKTTEDVTVILPAADYGCKKGHGNIVRDSQRRIGQQREGGLVHFLTKVGQDFLRQTDNPLLKA